MALEISKTFANGSTGNYWRITNLELNIANQRMAYIIECWKDVSYRNAGAPSLDSMRIDLSISGDFPYPSAELSTTNIYAIGYAKFKLLDYFAGALDV